jgi:hypothetical protein
MVIRSNLGRLKIGASETQHVNMQVLNRGIRVSVSNPEHLSVELAAAGAMKCDWKITTWNAI